MNWKGCDAVESRKDKLSGAVVFTGTRIPDVTLFENLKAGDYQNRVRRVFLPPEQLFKALGSSGEVQGGQFTFGKSENMR